MIRQNPEVTKIRLAISPEIYLSDTAARMYEQYCSESSTDDEAQIATVIRNFLEVILPVEYEDKQYALCGNFAMIYRRNIGPVQVAWTWHVSRGRIEVIFIEEALSQSQGDVSKRVAAGEFDHLLQAFGAKPPLRMTTGMLQ